MSTTARDEIEGVGVYPGRSLKDELTSLRIERKPVRKAGGGDAPGPAATMVARRGGRARDGGSFLLRLLSWVLWVIPLGLLAGGGYFAYSQMQKAKPRPTVSTAVVRTMSVGEANTILTGTGYIKARYKAEIGAKNPGRFSEVRVEEGMKVKKGDVLAILEHEDLKAQLTSRQAMVKKSLADLEEAKADLESRRLKSERYNRLRALGQVSEDENDRVQADFRMGRARANALAASIEIQNASINETRVSIDDMHILAPFDGTVVEKVAEVAETIALGGMGAASGRGSVVTLANLELLEVETKVYENKISLVSVGQAADITVTAVPRKHYQGRVRQIVPRGDRANNTIKVYVEILDPDDRLFPDLAATVNFQPLEVESASVAHSGLYVPQDGVVEEGGSTFAWVINARGAVEKRPIRVSIEDSRARIEEGLREGETVVLNPPASLSEGLEVTVGD
jgi:RND family efflux transporter MFP subunit